MGTYNVHAGHSLVCRGASGFLDEVNEDRKVKNKVIELLRKEGHKLVTTLSKLGEALGTFFGSIIDGFLNGATDGLPEVAYNLKEFINTFSGIDNNAANKVNSLIRPHYVM